MSRFNNAAAAHVVLRIGLAFAFLYPPYAALSNPISWESYFPHVVRTIGVPTILLLRAFGALEAVLALWILSGWSIRVPAALAAIILLAIVGREPNETLECFRFLGEF